MVFLKIIHWLAPGLSPIEVAKWGTRICGAALIPAVFWCTRQLLERDDTSIGKPLFAATIAVFHPVLWFYGGDGQSHAAEALLAALLLGASALVKRRDTRVARTVLVVGFGLAGSVRPTIPLLMSPLLIWVHWRRPLVDWAIAAAAGVVSVARWYVPLVMTVGGFDLYQRATKALVSDLFVSNYSVFGERSGWRKVLLNLTVTGYSAVLALIPVLAGSWPRQRRWFLAVRAVIAVNICFYALVFTSEPGYFSAVAAVVCVVPATWPKTARW